MTMQRVDTEDLAVVSPTTPEGWLPGAPEDGLDARLELTRVRPDAIAGSTSEHQIAVRDAQHPSGPALLFSPADWHALLGRGPNLVDLR